MMHAREATHPRLDLRAPARAIAKSTLHALEAPQELTQAAIGTWRGRMVNEHGSSRVFEGLARQMEQAGFSATEVREVQSFAEEERRHGILCGAVVEALGGEAQADALADEVFPLHEDATSAVEGVLRNAASIGCLSETVAVALIGAERLEMPEGPLRELLTKIWSEEVGHARFAWRLLGQYVPTLSDEGRRSLSAYLATAFQHLEAHELAHLPVSSVARDGGEALGLCSGREARELFYGTVERVIVPGLEAVGLSARAAWESRHRA
jgi:hypothetical protein